MSDSDGVADAGAITRLLGEAACGHADAFERLVPLVYDELLKLARSRLRSRRNGHSLLPHGARPRGVPKLVDRTEVEWLGRSHFFAVASNAMRQILIDHAKMKNAAKRCGGAAHMPLDESGDAALGDGSVTHGQTDWLVALHDEMKRLARFDERAAMVVRYRFCGGLRHAEIADVLGTSEVIVAGRGPRLGCGSAESSGRAASEPPRDGGSRRERARRGPDGPDHWARVQAICFAALEQATSDREAYVSRACGRDGALLREVRSLLAEHDANRASSTTRLSSRPTRPRTSEARSPRKSGMSAPTG